jgi:hypothetical protein
MCGGATAQRWQGHPGRRRGVGAKARFVNLCSAREKSPIPADRRQFGSPLGAFPAAGPNLLTNPRGPGKRVPSDNCDLRTENRCSSLRRWPIRSRSTRTERREPETVPPERLPWPPAWQLALKTRPCSLAAPALSLPPCPSRLPDAKPSLPCLQRSHGPAGYSNAQGGCHSVIDIVGH